MKKRLYQGTSATSYDPGRVSWWSDSRDTAEWFASERGGRVVVADVDLGNTAGIDELMAAAAELGYVATAPDWNKDPEDFTDEEVWASEMGAGPGLPVVNLAGSAAIEANSNYDGDNFNDIIYVPEVRAKLESMGFDSLMVSDALENYEIDAYVVWDPSRIDIVTNESVESRLLKQRDASWESGDVLAQAVDQFLEGRIDVDALRHALDTYEENKRWDQDDDTKIDGPW